MKLTAYQGQERNKRVKAFIYYKINAADYCIHLINQNLNEDQRC